MRRRAAHATRRIIPHRLGTVAGRLRTTAARHSGAVLQAARSNLLSFGLMLLMSVLILMLLINFGSQVVQSARLETDRAALETAVEDLRRDNDTLLGAVEYAESDVNVERIAREQLNYARDGDIVILPQVTLPTPTPAPQVATPAPLPLPAPNWQRWYGALFPSGDTVTR